MKNLDQTFRIKRRLAEKKESMQSLSDKTGMLYGSVVSNIYGYRSNRETQEGIADFLGLPVEELFSPEDNGASATRH